MSAMQPATRPLSPAWPGRGDRPGRRGAPPERTLASLAPAGARRNAWMGFLSAGNAYEEGKHACVDWPQRPMSVWQRQQIQGVLWCRAY